MRLARYEVYGEVGVSVEGRKDGFRASVPISRGVWLCHPPKREPVGTKVYRKSKMSGMRLAEAAIVYGVSEMDDISGLWMMDASTIPGTRARVTG